MSFKVGGLATVARRTARSGLVEPMQTLTVTRIMKQFIETDDGRKWSLDDKRLWPKSARKRWASSWLVLVPGSTRDLQKQALANQARQTIAGFVRFNHDIFKLSDDAALEIAERWKRDLAERVRS